MQFCVGPKVEVSNLSTSIEFKLWGSLYALEKEIDQLNFKSVLHPGGSELTLLIVG